ncbi:hypothetical protein DFH09DRAFT_1069754 [Mycena vulgaris]|nr:hypothetical protein DFH09DRAFT_1069754 [Mycena vulgaris]
MPYSIPASGVVAPPPPPAPSMHSPQGRPGHRRSYTFASDDGRPGAFASLGLLPRRTRSHIHSPPVSAAAPGSPRRAQAQFHFRADEEDSSESSEEPPPQGGEADDDDGPPPPLRLRQPAPVAFRLTPPTPRVRAPIPAPVDTTPAPAPAPAEGLTAVPFPRASPSPLSPTPASPLPAPTRPTLPARTTSTPLILLSNGKPLKSSLKSSSSAPHMPSHHLRARSAPSTPSLALALSAAGSPSDENGWSPGSESPGTPKNVRFPEPDAGLETVLLFKRSARPASVSLPLPLDDETETETETDRDVRWSSAANSASSSRATNGYNATGSTYHASGSGYPFPRIVGGRSPLNPAAGRREEDGKWRYVLEAPGVPRKADAASMVLLEGMEVECGTSSTGHPAHGELTLRGTLLARNAAFEKHLFVRFTLDGWCTTSEVGARWVESGVRAPRGSSANSAAAREGGEEPGPGWDRFAFAIRLTDYASHHSHAHNAHNSHAHAHNAHNAHSHAHAHNSHAAAHGSARGVGGVGRGLEGRELVLVARFWAPWVGVGGVGPYVWCGTNNPSAGAGTSPRGRAWVGTGGGGSGEWWDNNEGRDYKVAFRCVPVAGPPTPPTQQGVPFPSVEASSAPTTSAESDADASSSTPTSTSPPSGSSVPSVPSASSDVNAPPSPPPAHALPPPPPPPRTAHAQALAAKLGRLSLRNYAAPVARVTPPAGAVASPVVSPVTSPAAATSSAAVKEEGQANKNEANGVKMTPPTGQQSTGGVGLYWPWGAGATTAKAPARIDTSPPISPSSPPHSTSTSPPPISTVGGGKDEDDRSSVASEDGGELRGELRGAEEGEGEGEGETPPTSPLGASPLSGSVLLEVVAEVEGGKESKEETQTQMEPEAEKAKAAADASSSLYKAFVRQWCFAGAGAGAGAKQAEDGSGRGEDEEGGDEDEGRTKTALATTTREVQGFAGNETKNEEMKK